MKKLLILLISLMLITGCSSDSNGANDIQNNDINGKNNNVEENTNKEKSKKSKIYEETEKKKDEYIYQSVTLTLKKVINDNDELKNNRKHLENVLICGNNISIFIYSNKEDINIYSNHEMKLYSKQETDDFNLTDWCKNEPITDLKSLNQKEIDYLRK